MKVFITGASGFIGSALADRLRTIGHELVLAGRDVERLRARWPGCEAVAVDLGRDHAPEAWLGRLAGCDVVVNLVGIFSETHAARFEDLHVRGPIALFEASAQAGVNRMIQVSALGAGDAGAPAFLASKARADDALLALPIEAHVVRPSLVFGPEGASSRTFLQLALLPLVPLPGGGRQRVQPVDLDDLVDVLARLVEGAPAPQVLAAVGPRCLALRDYLAALRRGLDKGRQRVLAVPGKLVEVIGRMPGPHAAFANREALALLERGNCADGSDFEAVLGRPPRDPDHFVRAESRAGLRREAALATWLPALRLAVGLVWLWTAAVSFGLYPRAASLALLTESGVPAVLAPAALWAGAGLDFAFGLATLFAPRRWRFYGVQALLILAYTAFLSVQLPEFWLHPFGPLSKNLPMLAAIGLLAQAEA